MVNIFLIANNAIMCKEFIMNIDWQQASLRFVGCVSGVQEFLEKEVVRIIKNIRNKKITAPENRGGRVLAARDKLLGVSRVKRSYPRSLAAERILICIDNFDFDGAGTVSHVVPEERTREEVPDTFHGIFLRGRRTVIGRNFVNIPLRRDHSEIDDYSFILDGNGKSFRIHNRP